MDNNQQNLNDIKLQIDHVCSDLNNNKNTLPNYLNNEAYEADIESVKVDTSENHEVKPKTIRFIHCSDGILEECEEDEIEKERLEREEQERIIEDRKRLDIEAKTMPWLPWMSYFVKKNAVRTYEACDAMGEKLAWTFGITSPKFQYEIDEYYRMKREEEERNKDDIADEIIVGVNYPPEINTIDHNSYHSESYDKQDVEMRLFDENQKTKSKSSNVYKQQMFAHSSNQEAFNGNNL